MCGPGMGTLWVPEVKKQLEHTSQPINLAHVLSFLSLRKKTSNHYNQIEKKFIVEKKIHRKRFRVRVGAELGKKIKKLQKSFRGQSL